MSKLFSPWQIGGQQLAHRVVLAPLTRYRCDDEWVPLPIAKGLSCPRLAFTPSRLTLLADYYAQRACLPGTLLITEATIISLQHAGRRNVPGIWSQAQVKAWRDIVEAVHARDCLIFCQLWAQGRAGHIEALESAGARLMSSSAVPLSGEGKLVPEEMTEHDIATTIEEYAAAARNAMDAGFDGVEVHGGNGYLPDQFLQDTCNKRTDAWGGSIENRCRFHLEVMRAVVNAIGSERSAVRLSPWSDYLDMLMPDPVPTFKQLVAEMKTLKLAYLSLIEARISGNDDTLVAEDKDVGFLVREWDNTSPVILAGGFTAEGAREAVDVKYPAYDVAIAFGRHFISNPDLVFRVKESIEMANYDRSVFYTPKLAKGYTDYDYSPQFSAMQVK